MARQTIPSQPDVILLGGSPVFLTIGITDVSYHPKMCFQLFIH